MAFKQATIKEVRKRFDPAGEFNGLDVVVELEDTNLQKKQEVISFSKEHLQDIPGTTIKDKIGTFIKRQVKEKYTAWAKTNSFVDKDPVSTTNATAIQTELGFNSITQIDNL